jgi:hypothetical protein
VIYLREEVPQQLVSILEFVRHSLVRAVPVLVVIGQDAPGLHELLRWLDGMCIVISEYSLPIRLMERQRVANAVRNLWRRIDPPGLDLEPIAMALVDDLVVLVE